MAVNRKKKPKYEAPAVIPLGKLAAGLGQSCTSGSIAQGACNVGGAAGPQHCSSGNNAGLSCTPGANFVP